MAKLTVQKIGVDGKALTFNTATSTGDSFDNDGNTFFHIKNGGAAAITVTFKASAMCSHGHYHDHSVSVAAGAELVVSGFSKERYNDIEGEVEVRYSDVTSVSVSSFRV